MTVNREFIIAKKPVGVEREMQEVVQRVNGGPAESKPDGPTFTLTMSLDGAAAHPDAIARRLRAVASRVQGGYGNGVTPDDERSGLRPAADRVGCSVKGTGMWSSV